MQNDFVHDGGGLLVPDAEATLPAIRALLELARAQRDARRLQPGHPSRRLILEWRIWPKHGREGSWGWEIVDELAPGARRTRRPANFRYDAFYGTPLDHLLRLGGSTRS